MPSVSRYKIDASALKSAALVLQIGSGMADLTNSDEAIAFVAKAEDWVEQQISDFIMVPIKPVRAPGQSKEDFSAALVDESLLTRRNYPVEFIEAIIYRTLELMLHSNFFQNQANTSESGNWAGQQSVALITAFKDRPSFRTGGGYRRHPNPHMPPNIAPRQPQPPKA